MSNQREPDAHGFKETAIKPGSALNGSAKPEGYAAWAETNVYQQLQPGYAVVTISLPNGDFTSLQARKIADLARKYCGDNIGTTVEQNLLFRWVAEKDLPELYRELKAVGLGDFGAGTILDVVARPGTDTCKLGIAPSRGLARELRQRLAAQYFNMDAALNGRQRKRPGKNKLK